MEEIVVSNKKKRVVIAVLMLITPLCTMLPYLATSVLMTDIMTDLNVGYDLAGLTTTIMMVTCGLCMFIGSIFHNKIGIRKTLILAVWLLAVGSVICFFARSYSILIIGRIVSGIGFGLSGVSTNPYMSTWFKGKQRTFMITANLIANSIAGAISYAIANPLKDLVGTWTNVFGVYAAFITVIALLWVFLGCENTEFLEEEKGKQTVGKKSALSCAFRTKQYWVMMICGIFLNCASMANTSFMPTLLMSEKGFSATSAAYAMSFNTFAAFFGALLSGALVAKTGRRKIIMQLGISIFMVSGLIMIVVSSQLIIYICMILLGASYMFLIPAQSTILMETPEPFDPIIIGASMAMVSGIGQISSLLVSPLFSKLSESSGISGAMQIFFVIVLVSVIMSFFIKETGPKAKQKHI